MFSNVENDKCVFLFVLYAVEPVEDRSRVFPLVYVKVVDFVYSGKVLFADFSDLRLSWTVKTTSTVVSKDGFVILKGYENMEKWQMQILELKWPSLVNNVLSAIDFVKNISVFLKFIIL